MNAAEVAIRAVSYIAALLAFGASLFVLYAQRQATTEFRDDDAQREMHAIRRNASRVLLACAVVTICAGLGWLVVHAATIADVGLLQAASRAVAGKLLAETSFGRAMAWRLGLAAVLIAVVALSNRTSAESAWRSAGDVTRVLVAAAMLLPLAWMGHAAATRGSARYVHLCSDAAHLLAVGAWLGALPLLASILFRAAWKQSLALDRFAVSATRAFSTIGVLCVGALLATGTINAWYLVAAPEALFATTYGQLLLLKLALFAAMLVFAMRNRFVLAPRIRDGLGAKVEARRTAMRDIARNASIETVLGIAVVVIVGALGLSVPGAHADRVGPHHHGTPGLQTH